MKLKNCNPATLVGRTIIYRHQAWAIESVSGGTIKLYRRGLDHRGQLQMHQFAECRLFPTREEILAHFPRLVSALARTCKLSQQEAISAVRGQITTGAYYMASEAIAQLGGTGRAISLAWRGRHNKRR